MNDKGETTSNSSMDEDDEGISAAEAGGTYLNKAHQKQLGSSCLGSRRLWFCIVCGTIAVALAIGLSVGLTMRSKGNSNNGDPLDDANNTTVTGDEREGNETETRGTISSGANDTSTGGSNETDAGGNNASNNGGNTTDTEGSNSTDTGGGNNDTVPTVEDLFFDTGLGPLDTRIPLFGPGVAKHYQDRSELAAGLTQVGRFLANNVINRNLGRLGYEYVGMPMMMEALPDAAPGDNLADSASSANSYDTNNQEKGVDEGDVVKSDGNYIFAAYGNRLVIWKVGSGDVVLEMEMPLTSEKGVESQTRDIAPYQTANIQSLLLTENRLVVILSGYYSAYAELGRQPILSNYGATHVRMYDTSTLNASSPQLKFLGSKELNGYLKTARSIAENAHIVTSSGLNLYEPLVRPLERYEVRFADMSDEEYEQAASSYAEDVVIPLFVSNIIREISMGNLLPRFAQIVMFQTASSMTDAESIVFSDGVVNSIVQISSFSTSPSSFLNEQLPVSASGVFLPSYWAEVYATEELLVVAGQGWNFNQARNSNTQATYLVGFNVLGDSTTPAAIGHVPGYLLNQFSMDHVIRNNKSYLRAATTIRNEWVARPFVDDRTGNTVSVRQLVPTTQNQVLILEVPKVAATESAVMTTVSSIDNLGKEGEVFTALRFLDDIGFAVTYERIDPFYVLDLNVLNPGVLGELDNITGFSQYLHPMDVDNNLILAIGRAATPEGRDIGLQITMFDVTDPVDPKQKHRLLIPRDETSSSSSEASFDHKAFRYIGLDTDRETGGVLIIPVNIYNWNNPELDFDGFKVFNVWEQTGISNAYNVSHSEGADHDGCSYFPRFSGRSKVFDGDLVTLKSHVVKSTDLATGTFQWAKKMECRRY